MKYCVINLPGQSSLKIATSKGDQQQPQQEGSSSKAPEWMFSIAEANTASGVPGFEKFSELYGFQAESSRHAEGDSAKQPSAKLYHSPFTLHMPVGPHMTSLIGFMNQGKVLETITIVRIVTIGDKPAKAQEIILGKSVVTYHQQLLDNTCFFRVQPVTVQITLTTYSPEGTAAGNNVTMVDYSQNTAS